MLEDKYCEYNMLRNQPPTTSASAHLPSGPKAVNPRGFGGCVRDVLA